jgi:hypothetical protein
MIGLGDDNVLAVDVPHRSLELFCDHLTKTITAMGLKPKLKVANRGTTYCSSEFVPVATSNGRRAHILVPMVARTLSKLGCTTSKLSFEENGMRLKGNMLGNKYMAYMPVLRVFYRHYTSLKGTGKSEYQFRPHDFTEPLKYQTTEETLDWFTRLHGISMEQLESVESFLAAMLVASKQRPSMYDHSVLTEMLSARELM